METWRQKVGVLTMLPVSYTHLDVYKRQGYASQVEIQKDKSGIGEDAVSAVIPQANIYMPFAELVDIEKELERLKAEEKKLKGELARVQGMLNNEKFMSKAPEAKVLEERAKLEKYTQMMEQVKDRLSQLEK